MSEEMEALKSRIVELEKFVTSVGNQAKDTKHKENPGRTVSNTLSGMSRAYCIETIDPWKENRVRFYHPLLHRPDSKLMSLPFARPVSSFGGFDDCGLNWVPPAGSQIVMFFENGNISSPFYIGTTWFRDRGPSGNGYPFPSREWDSVYRGHRGGYLVGKDDESQVRPPWNTESYNGYDLDNTEQLETDVQAQSKITYPNIYGFKTPEKHMIKMVDGNAKCNRRWKRFEIMSGCGNWMIFKDDHLHYGGQWSHPTCQTIPSGLSNETCSKHDTSGNGPYFTDIHGEPLEKQKCDGQKQTSTILGGHTSTPNVVPTKYQDNQQNNNDFFKHRNECRPYKGPGTPQNNRCNLPQSGWQVLSISGHTIVFDDSVEEPRGIPNWERSTESFDFGCNDKYTGVLYLKSATGHSLIMSDVEEKSKLRGKHNYIELKSAGGNRIQLNDHTIGESTGSCPPNLAGEERGIHIESTSKHKIRLSDHLNEQCSPSRSEGGVPVAKATKAFIQIKSGYGTEMKFSDDFSQETTQQQWIQITHPQCVDQNTDDSCNSCNEPDCRGPHFLRFQGRPKGQPGIVFLRAGGHSIRQTYDKDIVLVGDRERNPSDKFTYVSKKFITASEDVNFNYTGESHVFFAEKQIHLLAGRDCPPAVDIDPNTGENRNAGGCKNPCSYPVVIGRCMTICPLTGIVHWTEKSLSERVFASGSHACQAGCGSALGDGIDEQPQCTQYNNQMSSGGDPPDCFKSNQENIDTGAGNVSLDNSRTL